MHVWGHRCSHVVTYVMRGALFWKSSPISVTGDAAHVKEVNQVKNSLIEINNHVNFSDIGDNIKGHPSVHGEEARESLETCEKK